MFRFFVVVLGSFLASVTASAGVLNDFNLIAFGDVTGTSEVEGRALVFGDVKGNSKGFAIKPEGIANAATTTGVLTSDGLVVGGQVMGSIHVNNGGVQIGGEKRDATINNAQYVHYDKVGVQQILNEAVAEIGRTTAYFDHLTANSLADLSDFNTAKFISNPVNGVSVFDVDSSLFSRNGMMDLVNGSNPALDPAADLYLFRVSGTNIPAGSALNVFNNEFGLDSFQQRIVWYFPDALSLSFQNGLGGAVIAPLANITLKSPLEGTVVGNNIDLQGEIHLPSLILPSTPTLVVTPTGPTNTVPEPVTIASVGLILCGALIGRRRRKAKLA